MFALTIKAMFFTLIAVIIIRSIPIYKRKRAIRKVIKQTKNIFKFSKN